MGTSNIRFANDVSLFILDDEGVFFSGSGQEVYAFNTPATYIWSCLEEGLSPAEIVTAYQGRFGVGTKEAGKHVADILHRWQGQGYIDGVEIPHISQINLTTALGRLLATPSLRRTFVRSPLETARKLAIREADLDAFLALDPEAFEVQAEAIRARQAASRYASPTTGYENVFFSLFPEYEDLSKIAIDARMQYLSPASITRYYRFLTTSFCLRFTSHGQEERVHPILSHSETDQEMEMDVILDILEGEAGHLLLQDAVPIKHCTRLDQLAPMIGSNIARIAIDRHTFFLEIHAGVVFNGEKGILLPGGPGSGKTTLAAGLTSSGFEYFSDEIALLEEQTLRLRPMPLSLSIKAGAVDLLSSYYPVLPNLPTHSREDEETVRYLRPPQSALCYNQEKSYPIGWIIFPRYIPMAETSLRPLRKAEALSRLMGQCLVLPAPLDKFNVASLVDWMRQVDCFELSMSSLAEAVQLVKRLCL